MSKRKRNRSHSSILERKPGKSPGYLFVPSDALAARFFLISYKDSFFEEVEYQTYAQLLQKVQERPDLTHWIDLRGYGDLSVLEQLTQDFQIHRLQMEDVINEYQRPKVDEFDNRLFIITRMLRWSQEQHKLDDVQLSVFTGPNYILTLQSDYEDSLEPLRERIRGGRGTVRQRPPIYLAYAISDVVLDYYFPVMASISAYAEELEQIVLDEPSKQTLRQVLSLRNELVKLRHIAWPERDKMTEILRMDEDVIPENLKVYFRDAYDHTIQLIDLIDNQRELTSNLVELYMSTVSNRMNEIMKVLTMISGIFIPLSFVVGLYGMNFARENPETGEVYRYSMPELYFPYSYPVLLLLMVVLVLVQFFFFWRKGWFRKF